MKKIIKKQIICILTILMLLQLHIPVYAKEWSDFKQIPNAREFNSQEQVSVTGVPRGRLISSVEIQLTDKGRGTAGIYADLLCHEPMAKLRIWIYLEKWDEETERWETEDYQQFTWLAEDYPDEDLTMAMVGYDVSGLERGQYYRLRGLFGANDIDSSLQEAWQAVSGELYFE